MRGLILLVCLMILQWTRLIAQTIIPSPVQTIQGEARVWVSALRFADADDRLRNDLHIFNGMLEQAGCTPLVEKAMGINMLYLRLDPSAQNEEYTMIGRKGDMVEIRGGKDGVFYGLMSLLQLMIQNQQEKNLVIPSIHDIPSFRWRGMHLDVSRHFFPKSFIKKYIDLLALHKMNTFHWHLTDDQGWRIEIKRYPLLTQIGSKRKETMVDKHFDPYVGDHTPVEGYYTQEEIKEIVAYASERHINVVPEIEMPGHSQAALSAYPEFGCSKKPLEPLTKWGVSEDVYCSSEATLEFLRNVLDEVMTLFPSPYIHIGGDEVLKTHWKNCPVCQQTIKQNHLKDENELQSYFIRQIDAYVTSKGRSIIGWDEILEGGLAPNAAVMSWRGEEGGIAAAKAHHLVVMTPGSHCYFDHYQGNPASEPLAIGGYTPLEKVYAYEPIPASLPPNEGAFILGAQGNVWTEYIPSSEQVEYMALPRLCALSEVLWSGAQKPGYADFKKRLRTHFNVLDRWQVHYATSVFDPIVHAGVGKQEVNIEAVKPFDEGHLEYRLNQSKDTVFKPWPSSNKLEVKSSNVLEIKYVESGNQLGNRFRKSYLIHKGLGKNLTGKPEPNPAYHTGGWSTLLDGIAGQAPRQNQEWLGWSGQNPEMTLDLGSVQKVHTITIYTLEDELNWIYLPEEIEILTGKEGQEFKSVQKLQQQDIIKDYLKNKCISLKLNDNCRFIKLKFNSLSSIPAGKPGASEAAWLFLSELAVD